MPKLITRGVRLCHVPSKGAACVYLHGKRVILGPWPEHPRRPSEAVQAKFRAILAEYKAGAPKPGPEPENPTLAILCARAVEWSEEYYRGGPEIQAVRSACRLILTQGAAFPASNLGPRQMIAMREILISEGRTRTGANKAMGMVRRVIRRGVEWGLVPPATLTACEVVQPLRPGRTSAPEAIRRPAVADSVVEATLPKLSPMLQAMVRLQRATGMRPGELVRLTVGEIDRTGAVWVYRPSAHKSAWRGKVREIPLGPRAQEILRPWLRLDGRPVFSPRENATRKLADWRRAPGDAWTTNSYGHAVARACKRAGVERWSPQDLRKAAGQELRDRFGLEVSAAVLGHGVDVSERHYTGPSKKAAMEAVAVSG